MELNNFSLMTGLAIGINIPLVTIIIVTLISRYRNKQQIKKKREKFITNYQFSFGFKEKFAKTRSYLSSEQQALVFSALKDYFLICYKAEQRMVSMPSQIVDEAWHEFILFTKEYSDFCSQGFGYFLHHTPAEAMKTGTQGQQGIRLAWELACQKDHINSYQPQRLPLLFAIDTLLEIENGFYYTLDCFQHKKTSPENSISSYCVTDIIYGVGCGGHSDSYDHSVDTNIHHSTIDHTSCGSGHSCGSSCGSSCGGGCGGGCGGC